MMKREVQLLLISTLISIIMVVGSSVLMAASTPNRPPNPPIIEGETNGNISSYYVYTFTLTDPDDNILLNLEIDWGDGTEFVDCGCGKTWQNGTCVNVSHSFKSKGTYGISARIQDEYGVWSNWSEPYVVSMPKFQKDRLDFHSLIRSLFVRFILAELLR